MGTPDRLWEVEVATTGREVYVIEAATEEEARATVEAGDFCNEPVVSEASIEHVTSVRAEPL